jgi:hypothetical protein
MSDDLTSDRLDLSPLEPDPDRWEALIRNTLRQVDQVLGRQIRTESPLELIAGWRRPLLGGALAATLAVAVAEILLELREPRMEQVHGLVALSTDWAATGQPTAADFLRALHSPSRPGEGHR